MGCTPGRAQEGGRAGRGGTCCTIAAGEGCLMGEGEGGVVGEAVFGRVDFVYLLAGPESLARYYACCYI